MKVIAHFTDGATWEISVPETESNKPTVEQALEYGKKEIPRAFLSLIKSWEVEEEFL